MRGRMMHDEEGLLTFQPYGREGQAINSISRGGLNEVLMTEAEKLGVKIHFNHRCVGINFDDSIIHYSHNDIKGQHSSDIIIGSDGAFSVVRRLMQRTDRFNYSQHYIEHGYKELTIPKSLTGGYEIEKNALHIWPRGNFMLIALPNQDATFTCTLFFPFEGDPSFSSLKSDEQISSFFQRTFPDAYDLMPSLVKEFNQNPTSSLITIKCYPWVKNKTLLIGDSSHAIVPFYGQGMNASFEDVVEFDKVLDMGLDNWESVFKTFHKNRKPEFLSFLAPIEKNDQNDSKILAASPIKQYYAFKNSEEEDLKNKRLYIQETAKFVSDSTDIGIKFVSLWWERNLHIMSNIDKHIGYTGRVLVLVGGAHRAVLKDFYQDRDDVNYIEIADYLDVYYQNNN